MSLTTIKLPKIFMFGIRSRGNQIAASGQARASH